MVAKKSIEKKAATLITLVGGRFSGERYRVDSSAYRIDPSDDEGVVTYYRNPSKPDEFIADDPDDNRLLIYKAQEFAENQAERDARYDALEDRVKRLEEIVGNGIYIERWGLPNRNGECDLTTAISNISQNACPRWGRTMQRFERA